MILEPARQAAIWWANKLRSPQKQQMGTDAISVINGAVLSDIALSKFTNEPINDEHIQAFENTLAKFIHRHATHNQAVHGAFGCYECTVSVDYNPDALLVAVARIVGLDIDNRLPAKTVMWVEETNVMVSEGYGAKPIVIWQR